MKKRLITGFQLEDYNPKNPSTKKITYGHDDTQHLKKVKKGVGGCTYPRESYYKWHPSWKPGPKTKVSPDKQTAHGKEKYIQTKDTEKSEQFLSKRTVKGRGKSIKGSWIVPDTRIYNTRKKLREFKNAYLITKKIDRNSRLSMVTTDKSKAKRITKELKNEKVKIVKVQNYKPKSHSFFSFIKSE